MDQSSSIDPLARQVAQFVLDTYGPKLVRTVRRHLTPHMLGWIALAGTLVVVPIAVAAMVRLHGERTSNRRYDTTDYLSDDLL